MNHRSPFRWMVWSLALAVTLLGSRSAMASAAVPMCDERGASAIAPSPVLPIRDVKLESAPPQPCDYEPSATLIAGRPRASGADVVATGDSLEESWVKPQVLGVFAPCASSVPPPLTMLLYPTAAHQRGVFRPPRA